MSNRKNQTQQIEIYAKNEKGEIKKYNEQSVFTPTRASEKRNKEMALKKRESRQEEVVNAVTKVTSINLNSSRRHTGSAMSGLNQIKNLELNKI